MKRKKKRSYVIIGLGMFGGTIAEVLAEMGDEVLGIDKDEGQVRRYVDKLSHSVIADASDEHALADAGVGGYDVAVIAIGEDLEANILATMNVKMHGVPVIWVKALSRTHHRILNRIGVDRIIHPERDIGVQIAETLHTPFIADFINLGDKKYLVNFVIHDNMDGFELRKYDRCDENSWCIVGLMRKGNFVDCKNLDIKTQQGDHLLAIGSKEELRELSTLF